MQLYSITHAPTKRVGWVSEGSMNAAITVYECLLCIVALILTTRVSERLYHNKALSPNNNNIVRSYQKQMFRSLSI